MKRILIFFKPNKSKLFFALLFLIIGIGTTIIIFSYGESGWNRHSFLFNLISKITIWPLIPTFELKMEQSFWWDKILNIAGVPLLFIYYYCIGCLMSKLYESILKRYAKYFNRK